jgi:hypothetical protein
MKRLIRRLLGAADPGPGSSARQQIFPDLNANRDLGQLLGMFDPSNLGLYSRRLVKHREEQLMIRRGDFDGAAAKIKQELFLMDADERLSCAFLTTNDVHELRHVHDYFGTITGLDRFLRTIEDAFEFTKMWRALVDRGSVKLPLGRWARQHDAPTELKQYALVHQQYVEWCYLVQGSMKRLATPAQADTIVLYHLGGQPTAPAISVDVKTRTGDPISYAIPYGMHAVMESTAFALQRYAIRRVFGDVYARQATQALQGGSAQDTQWLYYLALEQLALPYFKTFYVEGLLAIADLAMMPGTDAARDVDRHPGYRLLRLMTAAKEVGPLDQDPGDLADYMDRLAAQCGWQKPPDVVRQRIEWCRSQLATDPGNSIWDLIAQAAIRVHLHCLELRQEYPALFASPIAYVSAFKVLPLSPIWIEGTTLQFWGVDERNATLFGHWYYIEHFQRQAWFETSMPCPFPPGAHTCPADAFRPGWKPVEICPFGDVVQQLGLPRQVEILA